MKIISEKPRGQRMFKTIKHNFNGHGKTKRPFWIEPIGGNWWFDLEIGEWINGYNGKGGMTTSYYSMEYDGFNNVYSLKSAKRLISKWNIPKGTKFIVSLPFNGYSFTIKK